jgi:hypothetical protein
VIDLRYHVYSLAAVFFALAIGIVIGSSFVGKPADKQQMLRIAEGYERDMVALRTEMRKQQDNLRAARGDFDRGERMCAALIPVALKDKLLYHNVAIIQTGDYDELAADLRALLPSVGARVTSVTKISPSFDFEDPALVSGALSAAGVDSKQEESDRAAILRVIAEAIVGAKHIEKLSPLEEKNVVNLSGDYTRWNRDIVIIGGSSSEDSPRAELVDVPLADRLVGLGANVVGCEPVSARSSYVPAWKRTAIATVDNADRSYGQVALICALAGETAHFGQKRTADRLIPQTLGGGE